MDNILVRNRIGISKGDIDLYNIKTETRDSINKADIEIIKYILKDVLPNSNYTIRYSPEAKGAFDMTTVIDFSGLIPDKSQIEYVFLLIGNVLTNYGLYATANQCISESQKNKEEKRLIEEKVNQEKINTEIMKLKLEEYKRTYLLQKNINLKYEAMCKDEEVKYNENIVSFGSTDKKIKEDRGDFYNRIKKLKASKDTIIFGGIIKIHSLVVDGNSKWSGNFFGDEQFYNGESIIKNGDEIKFRVEDSKFREDMVNEGSLSLALTLHVLLKANLEITDEIKPKDFIVLEISNSSKDIIDKLEKYKSNEEELFDICNINPDVDVYSK